MSDLIKTLEASAAIEDWGTVADIAWSIILHPEATEQNKVLARHLRTVSQRLHLLECQWP